jgi:hypothetical protein
MSDDEIETLKQLARNLGAKRLEINGEIIIFDQNYGIVSPDN